MGPAAYGYWARAVCRELTHDERAVAAGVALARNEGAHGVYPDKLYPKGWEDDMAVHLAGALGEAAYSVLFGVEWPMTIGTFGREPDFPPDLDVKCRQDVGRPLIVRPDSQDDWRFIAGAVTWNGRTQFDGWCWGSEAKSWPLSDPGGWRPAHFVPIAALHRFPLDARHERQAQLVLPEKPKVARRCPCHSDLSLYGDLVPCPRCQHWSFDPAAEACERRRCAA